VSDNPMFMYAGEYDDVDDAKADLGGLKELHREHLVGTYDAAVLTKNEKGKVKIVDKTEKPTQHGGWAGLAVGAAIGLIFPPLDPGKRGDRSWSRRPHRPPQGRDVRLRPQGGRRDARR
jgi:hypothetical protein